MYSPKEDPGNTSNFLSFMQCKNQDTDFDELCISSFSFPVILPKYCPWHGRSEIYLMNTVSLCQELSAVPCYNGLLHF